MAEEERSLKNGVPEVGVADEGKQGKKGGKLKLLLVIVVVLVLGGGAGYYFYGSKMLGRRAGPLETASGKKQDGVGPILSLEPFIFNISGGSSRYAKITIGIELRDEKIIEEAKKMIPAIRDKTLFVLSPKEPEALTDVNGRNSIKKELLEAIKGLFKGGEVVRSVYVTDIIIQ
jgi:flagellar protein FliL